MIEDSIDVYRAIRGGARRWDEWGFCWVARRYSLVLHCNAGAILLSLEVPGNQLLRTNEQAEPSLETRSGSLASHKGKREKFLKVLKLDAIDRIERITNVASYAQRRDVVGGLACLGMAIERAKSLEGGGKESEDVKRKPSRLWHATRIWKTSGEYVDSMYSMR